MQLHAERAKRKDRHVFQHFVDREKLPLLKNTRLGKLDSQEEIWRRFLSSLFLSLSFSFYTYIYEERESAQAEEPFTFVARSSA